MDDTILQFKNLTKNFPGVKALDDVSFTIKRGRVHALMGENGAGKSTLIKILAGIYNSYDGDVIFDGKLLKLKSPNDAQKHGISVVHQEIKLAETLTVTENIFLGNLIYKNGLVDWKQMHRRAQKMIADLGMDIDVNAFVDTLTVAKKQIVEICKAVSHECKVLVMDEPSAVLTDKELVILFDIMNNLVKSGVTIIYISHRMEEIFNLADDITVLRDGRHVDTMPVSECNRGKLIKMMVGRTLEREYPKEKVEIGETTLKVENLTRKGAFENISFELRKGEILGLSGLVGSGRTEVVRAMLGIDKLTSGTIELNGKRIENANFKQAIRRGFGLIPEDRKSQGLVQLASVKENICMVSIDKILKHGVVSIQREVQYANEYVNKLSVATPNVETEVQYLSGGNQQKVVIAKWLLENSDIIVMDEPTRGIDVGAKSEIYRLMCELVKQGKSIIMISSEMPEILGMCDRIVVMYEGRKVGELTAEQATQEGIMELCV
ncbi:sugar ABC transporter ATP-binding protein [Oscillospiraceae bacterium PP1C4]